jgi:hypothetical protein
MCAAGGTFVTATGIGVSELVEDVVLDACVLNARARRVLAPAVCAVTAAVAEDAWRASEASSASAAIARERIERA